MPVCLNLVHVCVLFQTLTKFNDKINRLVSGEVVNNDNLFVLLRSEFKKWKDHLDNTKASCEYTVHMQKP